MPRSTRALALVVALLLVGFQAIESGHVHLPADLATDCALCHGHAPLAPASALPLLFASWRTFPLPFAPTPAPLRFEYSPRQARGPPAFS